MLGAITRSLDEVYARLSDRPFVAEAKLDGQRGQIHVKLDAPSNQPDGAWYQNKTTGRRIWYRIFSRNLEDMTSKYPDCLSAIDVSDTLRSLCVPCGSELSLRYVQTLLTRESLAGEDIVSFIVDAEIVAIDPVTCAFRSFQELSYRSKKEVELKDVKIRVGVYAFDLMFYNGKVRSLHFPRQSTVTLG